MGLGLEHVQSEPSHYVLFVCQICNSLANMDAVVTGKCHHLFCKSCMDGWDASAGCPACGVSLEADSSNCSCRQSGTDMAPLLSAQPLAHACLSKVQISCPHCMTWEGEHGQLNEHAATCSAYPSHQELQRGRIRGRRSSLNMTMPTPPSKSPVRVTSSGNRRTGRRHSMMANTSSGIAEKRGIDDRYPATAFGGSVHTDGIASSHAALPDQKAARGVSDNRSPHNLQNLTDAGLLKEKGNARFNKGEYAEARQYYDQALDLVKDLKLTTAEERTVVASLFCNRGATNGKEKNVEDALRDYDSAIRIAPDYAKAYTRKFKVLAALGRLREAKTLLEGAVLNVPGDKGLIDDLRKTRQIVDGIQAVQKMLQMRNYVEAKQAGDALMKTTDNTEAVLLSAEADASIGLIDSAMDKCDFVLKTENSAIGLKTSGYISLLAGNLEVALSSLKESLKLDSNNIDAKELFRFCRKIQSDLAEGRGCIANFDAGGSRSILKKAVDCFSVSIDDGSLPPKSPLLCMIRIERSEAELQLMHYQSALSDARLAIEVNPASVRAWVVKADSYIATGRATEARDELQLARRTWAIGVDRIKEVCARAALECKIREADKELRSMVAHLGVEKKKGGPRTQEALSRSDHRDNRQRPTEKSPRPGRRQSMDSGTSMKSSDKPQQQQRRASVARPAVGRRSSVGSGSAAAASVQRRPENGRTASAERRHVESGRTASAERRSVENGRVVNGEMTRAKKQPQKQKPRLSESAARRRVSMI